MTLTVNNFETEDKRKKLLDYMSSIVKRGEKYNVFGYKTINLER